MKHFFYSFFLIFSSLLLSSACTGARKSILPTPETTCLFKLLKAMPEYGFMYGHHDDTVYGIGWYGDSARSDVKSVCGDYPGIISFDISGIEYGRRFNIDSVAFCRIREEAVNQYERGGVVSFSWHLNNPVTGGNAWDVSDTSVVEKILDQDSIHKKFSGWLDRVADFINSVKDEKGVRVPVIFRPFHENTGNWFWWGAKYCSPREYKALWKFTYEYLKNKGVNNVLFAYSPGGDDSVAYADRYPGDDFVDVLGIDIYQNGLSGRGEYLREMKDMLGFLTAFGKQHSKPIAVTETGLVTIPDHEWWTKTL
ncbi:MAG: glycoside hydrolase family 26 protein, partial [Bacteroidales bacterium]|nr:glycoside hydrolase family 26 protein [Bacteroidales bacterium]